MIVGVNFCGRPMKKLDRYIVLLSPIIEPPIIDILEVWSVTKSLVDRSNFV